MSKEVEDLLQRHKRLRDERRQWEDHWQELAEVMLPARADFTSTPVAGDKRTGKIYDGVPMLARRGLASAIDGLLKPKTSRWFRILAADAELNEQGEVKLWLEAANERMMTALYNPKAKFIQRSGEVDNDLVTFGTGVLFTGESQDREHLLFRSHHLRDVVIAENADGDIDTLFLDFTRTARQAAQVYGEEALGDKVKEALQNDRDPDRKFRFVQVVMPRHDRDTRKRDNRNLPFASVVIDVESQHKVGESGFQEFPFSVPRWDTMSGELYGRSPGMLALADALTLQEQGKTLLVAGHKAVDPPLLAADESVIGAIRTYPGGITAFDAEAARQLGGRPPIFPLNTGANIPLGREMLQDTRDQIWAAFFRNVLQLPGMAGPRMTATEVLERKEEFIRTIGPTFGRLEADYVATLVERVFHIMFRTGAFPEPPEALRGREVRFEFASPVQQARKQIEAAGAARSFELLAPLAQVQPDIWDHFNGDEIARDAPEIFGMPSRWLRTEEEVQTLRQGRAQAQQAMQMLSGAGQAAEVVEKVARLPQRRAP